MPPKKRGRESKKEASSKQPKLSKTQAAPKPRQPRREAPPKVCSQQDVVYELPAFVIKEFPGASTSTFLDFHDGSIRGLQHTNISRGFKTFDTAMQACVARPRYRDGPYYERLDYSEEDLGKRLVIYMMFQEDNGFYPGMIVGWTGEPENKHRFLFTHHCYSFECSRKKLLECYLDFNRIGYQIMGELPAAGKELLKVLGEREMEPKAARDSGNKMPARDENRRSTRSKPFFLDKNNNRIDNPKKQKNVNYKWTKFPTERDVEVRGLMKGEVNPKDRPCMDGDISGWTPTTSEIDERDALERLDELRRLKEIEEEEDEKAKEEESEKQAVEEEKSPLEKGKAKGQGMHLYTYPKEFLCDTKSAHRSEQP